MAAKLVVSKAPGGSRITLVGTSGTELLTSKVFSEPRGKGATLRSLKGLLGDGIVIEDLTAGTATKVEPMVSTPRPSVRARTRATAAKPKAKAKAKATPRRKPRTPVKTTAKK